MFKYTYWIAFTTIISKEMQRVFRIWTQSLLPSAITTLLYFLIFGHVLGKQIGPIHGYSYIQYIAPGLIMMSIITNTYSHVVFSFYMLRFNKSIEELLVAPIPNYLIMLGYLTAGILRGLTIALIVLFITLFFTHLPIYNLLVTIAVACLTALLFALAGFSNALFAKKFDDTMIVPTFILTPLNYLGGIFYPMSLLSSPWKQLSLLNPIAYIVNTFRYGILGITDISLLAAFLILIFCIISLFSLNLYLLKKGVGIRT